MDIWEDYSLQAASIAGTSYLIDGVLRENDKVLVVAREKVGKSLFTLQMAACLSAGIPFLGFRTDEKRVLYIGSEGDLDELQDARKNMALGGLGSKRGNLYIAVNVEHAFNSREGYQELMRAGEEYSPDVVIVDPIYATFNGTLSDDAQTKVFLEAMNQFRMRYDAAIILTHHAHRLRRNQRSGEVIDEGDEAIFGSFAWKAWAKVVYLLTSDAAKMVTVSCATHRGKARAIDRDGMKMVLIEPTPLRLEPYEGITATAASIRALLGAAPNLTQAELCAKLGKSQGMVSKGIVELEQRKEVVCDGYPKRYTIV